MNSIKNNRDYLMRLLSIAVPIMLSNLIAQLQMVIDRIFLGRVNTLYMSALGNVTSPMWTTMSFCFAIATGASILISQSVGANNREHIGEYAGALIKYNNIVPAILFLFWFFCAGLVYRVMGVSDNLMPMCLEYAKFYAPVFLITGFGGSLSVLLQTSNYTKPLVMYGIVRSGLNVVLDYIMIFGKFGCPAMGIKGAAIATCIAEYVGGIFILFVILNSKLVITRPSMHEVKESKLRSYLVCAKLGVNTALEDFAWNFGNLVLIRILNSINEMAAGIYSIVFSVEILAVVIVGAIGSSTMTLTSEAKGRKDKKQYVGVCIYAYALCMIVMVFMLITSILFPSQIIGLFTTDAGVIASSGIYLILISLNLIAKSANIIVGNGIRGSGNTKWMLYTQMFGTVWIVSVAAFFVYGCHLGILGVFFAVMVDELVRGFINFWKYYQIVKKWEKEA